jgi:hypothetical protein
MTEMTGAERLSIRPGVSLWFSPIEWLRLLGPLPPGVRMTGDFAAATVAVIFVSNSASVRWFLNRYGTVMTRPPAVWICAPTHGRTDFNLGLLESTLAGHGFRALGEVPIDASWTAVRVGRFVPGPPPPASAR